MLEPLLGGTVVGHGGVVEHASAYAGGLPDRGLGVAVAFNAADVPMQDVGQGMLAIAAGESPAAAVPGLGVREKVAAVTGTYEGYRGAVTTTVEDDGGRLSIAVEPWGVEFPALPESSDPEDHSFYTVAEGGRREAVAFREYESGMAMLWSRARLDQGVNGVVGVTVGPEPSPATSSFSFRRGSDIPGPKERCSGYQNSVVVDPVVRKRIAMSPSRRASSRSRRRVGSWRSEILVGVAVATAPPRGHGLLPRSP